jgi:hypothetical protein
LRVDVKGQGDLGMDDLQVVARRELVGLGRLRLRVDRMDGLDEGNDEMQPGVEVARDVPEAGDDANVARLDGRVRHEHREHAECDDEVRGSAHRME